MQIGRGWTAALATGISCTRGLAEQFADEFFAREIKINCYVAKDLSERGDSDLLVNWNGHVMFDAFEVRCEVDMAAGLASGLVSEATQSTNQVVTADVAGNLQAGMTSSLTM